MGDVVARTRAGWSAARGHYMAQLLAERLTGQPQQSYSHAAMHWGLDVEPEARRAYAFEMNLDVTPVGFVPHPTISMSGASPDGLVGEVGLVEIKCPQTATHLDIVMGGAVPDKYLAQMQWQMACTGRAWCDFVSYDPRLSAELRLIIRRVARDEAQIAALREDVVAFLGELDARQASLASHIRLIAAA
jgi:putative phage-type endonuclease